MKYTKSSGNIFKDLALPNPEVEYFRAELGEAMRHLIRGQLFCAEKTQADIARQLGWQQPDISLIMHGKMKHFTIDRILKALYKLAPNAHITVDVDR